ncbi:MAG: MFS transporter [Pigmentiphaga sp.]|nr:MFS transporter [Pigmentiphaga sp.]
MTRTPSAQTPSHPTGGLGPAVVLATGTFAVGTDAFVVTGFLPAMAADLGVSTAAAGQSLTLFAITYAILAPLLTSLTAQLPRRTLLAGALLLLGLANIGTALAPNLGLLLLTRVLAAAGAALYTPNAGSVAGMLVRPDLRGRAFALVITGLTVATAIGVPLGLLASQWLGWRSAISLVALLALAASLGVRLSLPAVPGASSSAPLRHRLSVLRLPSVRAILPLTWLGMAASYVPYVYSVGILGELQVPPAGLAFMLFLYGAGAVIGVSLSGWATDRSTPARVLAVTYIVMALSLAGLAWMAVAGRPMPWLIGLCMLAWGGSSWSQTPPQQHRLFEASHEHAMLLVALNASGIYVGIGLGTLIGGLTIAFGGQAPLIVGTVIALGALVFLRTTRRAFGPAAATS